MAPTCSPASIVGARTFYDATIAVVLDVSGLAIVAAPSATLSITSPHITTGNCRSSLNLAASLHSCICLPRSIARASSPTLPYIVRARMGRVAIFVFRSVTSIFICSNIYRRHILRELRTTRQPVCIS